MATLARQRARAFRHQHGRCIYCNALMWLQSPRELQGVGIRRAQLLQATAEHIHARCDGGTDACANIAAACWYCNQHRHRAKKPLAFPAYQARVRRRMMAGKWHGCQVTL